MDPIRYPIDFTINTDLLKEFKKAFPNDYKKKLKEAYKENLKTTIDIAEGKYYVSRKSLKSSSAYSK